MQTIIQAAAPITITTGATALLFVVNPYVFYGSLAVGLFTCFAICIHIIRRCLARDKRLDALKTRATRRAYAATDTTGKHGDN